MKMKHKDIKLKERIYGDEIENLLILDQISELNIFPKNAIKNINIVKKELEFEIKKMSPEERRQFNEIKKVMSDKK